LEELVAKRPLDGKPFFVAHGTLDEMVPVERARQSIAVLEQAGAQVTYCEAEVAHRVSADCLRALKSFLQD
jgi:predicted esterase